MGWPVDAGLRTAAAGTAEAGQSDHHRAEQGGQRAGSVIFHMTRGFAGSAERPPSGMIAALRGDDLLLHAGEELLALSVRQAQSGEIA